MQFLDSVQLRFEFREKSPGKRNRPVLFALPVMNGDFSGIKIQALNAEIESLEQTQAAPVE